METKGINPKCIRIDGIDRIRTAYIYKYNYCVASIADEYCSLSGMHDWVITPYYDACDALAKEDRIFFWAGIPGIDLDLRKKEYIRNYTPVFVTQRMPPECNEFTPAMLREIHLDSYDPFEIMCRTHGICGNNEFYVSRFKERTFTYEDREKLDIPDFDTSSYGWIVDGKITPYDLTKKIKKRKKINFDYLM